MVGGRGPAKICSVVWNGTRPIPAGFTKATCTSQKHLTPFQYLGRHISPHVLHNHGIRSPMHVLPGPLSTKNTSKGWVLRHTLTGQGWHQGEHKKPPVSSQGLKLKSEGTGVLQRCHSGIECYSNAWRLFSAEPHSNGQGGYISMLGKKIPK